LSLKKIKYTDRVLYLGSNGFPFGSATVQRQIQIAKSLNGAGFHTIVVCRRSPYSKEITNRENISRHGYFEGIEYYYSSILQYRSSNFLIRNIVKLSGILFEFLYLLYFFLFKKVKYLLYRSDSLGISMYYYYYSKLFNVDVIYDYVELYDSLRSRKKKKKGFFKRTFDKNFFKYTDKIIVISEFLRNHIENQGVILPIVKVPPTIDFSYFDDLSVKNHSSPFLLFCGNASYADITRFIVQAYKNSNAVENGYNLKLVLNGSNSEIERLNIYINNNDLKRLIHVRSKISYIELLSYYKQASALLIPLSNNIQDQARFPFKISEYTASKTPIITSNTGAIKEYFTNNENALIAKVSDVKDFSKKINFIFEFPNKATDIGLKGYELGKDKFNYVSYKKILKDFILS